MVNFVDEVLNTASTGNKIKYLLTKEDSSTELVQIDLVTPVTTQGTPLNKATFDSIKADIEARLEISSKATQAEVVAGTNDTKYITPQKLSGLITSKARTYTSSETSVQTDTIYTFTNTTGRCYIDGWLKGNQTSNTDGYASPSNGATVLTINYDNGSTQVIDCISSSVTQGFKIEVDYITKQMYVKGMYHFYSHSGSQWTITPYDVDKFIQFTSIQSIEIKGKYGSGTHGYSIAVYKDF